MAEPSFLDIFPVARRSTVSNRFLTEVRAGITEPAAVVQEVIAHCDSRYEHDIFSAIIDFPAEAHAYAVDRIAWNAMPYEDRLKLKAERVVGYRNEWMQNNPPTGKQLAYLIKLGHRDIPATADEASQIIDRLVKR